MKKITNFVTIGCLAALLTLAFNNPAAAQGERSGNVKTSMAPVTVFLQPTIIPQAGAKLSRNNEGIFGHISTSHLPLGEVVTLWWAIFNDPSQCAGELCVPSDLGNPSVNGSLQFGGGAIVGPSGRADFAGYLGLNDNSGYYILPMFPKMPDPAPGLTDSKGAEVHMVIRKHGLASADPVILQEQLSTFTGGCSVPMACANIQAAVFAR